MNKEEILKKVKDECDECDEYDEYDEYELQIDLKAHRLLSSIFTVYLALLSIILRSAYTIKEFDIKADTVGEILFLGVTICWAVENLYKYHYLKEKINLTCGIILTVSAVISFAAIVLGIMVGLI